MPFADEYVLNAHPPLPLHPKVPRPWALDTYSTVILAVCRTVGPCESSVPFGMNAISVCVHGIFVLSEMSLPECGENGSVFMPCCCRCHYCTP